MAVSTITNLSNTSFYFQLGHEILLPTFDICQLTIEMPATSLCFKEARDARSNGAIGLHDYVNHIVAHYGGITHESDLEEKRPWFPAGFEDEVRKLVLAEDFQVLDAIEVALIHEIYLMAFEGNVESIRKLLKYSQIPIDYLIRPLVSISMQEGYPQLFQTCVDNGFKPTGYNDQGRILDGARRRHSLEWLHVLFNVDFRQWKSDRQQLCEWNTWSQILRMGPGCVRWWIDHGGRAERARGLFEWERTLPGAATIGILLENFGVDWFSDSGTLQYAAKNGDMESVKLLVDAGADINENVTDWNTDVREHRAAPLSALHEAVYAKSETMIRYLVEHGARLPRKYVADPYDTTPKDVKVFKDLVEKLGAVDNSVQL